MRIFDTKYFIDRHRELVESYYANMVEDYDVSQGSILRAVLELKMYHLPPYFTVPLRVKTQLNNLYRNVENNIVLEYDLLHPNATIHGTHARDACTTCGRVKQLATLNNHTMCPDCWVNLMGLVHSLWKAQIDWCEAPVRYFNLREAYHMSTTVPGYEWFWDIDVWKDLCELDNITQMKAEFKFILAAYKKKAETCSAYSPKHTLLAHLIGCRNCGKKHPIENVWTSPALGWMDGLCPDCKPKRGIWHNSQYEPIGYDACQVCHNLHLPYAMWGMCMECYQNWQDTFLNEDVIYATAKQLGTSALLLIRPEVAWINYIKDNLPTSYSRKGGNGDRRLVEFKPKLKPEINIKERVLREVIKNVS